MAADARRQGRVQNWEAKLAAMDAARRQYNAAAAQAPLQGALAFMPTGGFKFGGVNAPAAPVAPVAVNPYTSSNIYSNPANYGNTFGSKDYGYESTLPFPELS